MGRGIFSLLAVVGLALPAWSVPMYQTVDLNYLFPVPGTPPIGVFEVWYDRPPGALGPMVVTDSQFTPNLPGAGDWTWSEVKVIYYDAVSNAVGFDSATDNTGRYTLRLALAPYYPAEGPAGWYVFDQELPYEPGGHYWGILYGTAGPPQIIPEPSPFALVGLSLGVMAVLARGRGAQRGSRLASP